MPLKALPDPGKELPRDPTGSFLHLKLKRFPSVRDLTMPYAKKTWQQYPYDISVAVAPNARASCRQCHKKIDKGELRFQLLLQCHKGCKNSAYFHGEDCIWKYPETAKINVIEEVDGLKTLPQTLQTKVTQEFSKFWNDQVNDDDDDEYVSLTSRKRPKGSSKDGNAASAPAKKKGKMQS